MSQPAFEIVNSILDIWKIAVQAIMFLVCYFAIFLLFASHLLFLLTGTSISKRKNFVRMMEDAKDGHFDLIVTREVSRFKPSKIGRAHV